MPWQIKSRIILWAVDIVVALFKVEWKTSTLLNKNTHHLLPYNVQWCMAAQGKTKRTMEHNIIAVPKLFSRFFIFSFISLTSFIRGLFPFLWQSGLHGPNILSAPTFSTARPIYKARWWGGVGPAGHVSASWRAVSGVMWAAGSDRPTRGGGPHHPHRTGRTRLRYVVNATSRATSRRRRHVTRGSTFPCAAVLPCTDAVIGEGW